MYSNFVILAWVKTGIKWLRELWALLFQPKILAQKSKPSLNTDYCKHYVFLHPQVWHTIHT